MTKHFLLFLALCFTTPSFAHLVPTEIRQSHVVRALADKGHYKTTPKTHQRIGDVRPSEVSSSTKIGPAKNSDSLDFTIELGLKDEDQFADRLDQIYTKGHPNYHKFLKTGEFAILHEPTPTETNQVIDHLSKNGIVTKRSAGRHLSVTGKVSDLNAFFHTEIHQYQDSKGVSFLAPLFDVSVPKKLGIVGVHKMHTFPHKAKANVVGTYAPLPYIATFLRMMYDIPSSLTGTGQVIAIDGLPFNINDIRAFEASLGFGGTEATITPIGVDGFDPTYNPATPPDTETTVDISTILAIAPNISTILVYENEGDPVSTLNQIAIDNKATTVSTSFSGGYGSAPLNTTLQQMAAQGQSVFAASGDSGCANLPSPGDQPFITGVGGTVKGSGYVNGVTPTYPGENTWQYQSGGGISATWPIPSYQRAAAKGNPQASKTKRNVPDVAAFAGTHYAPWYYIYANGVDSGPWAGTSIASPLWAAFIALTNQSNQAQGLTNVGFLNPALYKIGASPQYSATFHDMNDGNSNANTGCRGYTAIAGYDLVTGWGSMNGAPLIAELAKYSVPVVTKPAEGSFYIHAGGSSVTDSTGQVWQADTDFQSGAGGSTTHGITGTTDPELYQNERWGNPFSYVIPSPNGTYSLTLKFAEIYFGSPGQRIFNVSVNGTQVITNLDIYAKVGNFAAYDVTIPLTVTTGVVQIVFTSTVNEAKISAIGLKAINTVPTNPSLSPVAAQCGEWLSTYNIVPYVSWGSTPGSIQGPWNQDDCNHQVCYYFAFNYGAVPNGTMGTLPANYQAIWNNPNVNCNAFLK